jgi:hypothetical protein
VHVVVQNGKTDLSGGLFSAVVGGGLRRFGDLAKTVSTHGNSAATGTGGTAAGNSLRKRTFSEVGKLHSTVAAQQFVFSSTANTMLDESSQQFSRQGGESSMGFGATRTGSLSAAAGSSRPRSHGGANRTGGAGSGALAGSLFAQLGAKRSSLPKSASLRQ